MSKDKGTEDTRRPLKSSSSLVAIVYLGGDFLFKLAELVLREGARENLRTPFDQVVDHVANTAEHLAFVPLSVEKGINTRVDPGKCESVTVLLLIGWSSSINELKLIGHVEWSFSNSDDAIAFTGCSLGQNILPGNTEEG